MAHAHGTRRIRSRMTTLSGMLLVMIGLGASASLGISEDAMDWYLSNARHLMSVDERAKRGRWAMLRQMCPEQARIIATHEQNLSGRLRLVIDMNPDWNARSGPGWQDIALIVSRESMNGYLLARAVEPISVPADMDDADAWDRWMHDSRVRMSWIGRSELNLEGGLPRLLGHAGFSDHDLSRLSGDPTPVDPCNGR